MIVLGIWMVVSHIRKLRQGASDTLGGHISLVVFGVVLTIGGIINLILFFI